MNIQVDIWLRGTDFATTETIEGIARPPAAWLDEDVRQVLEGMLKAMHRRKHPAGAGADEQDAAGEPRVALRGFSWIVNPYEDGGVVIAIEIALGAAIAGPFEIDKSLLEAMITRVIVGPPAATVH